ncbi:hypothetical protein PENTCL1PPCAC_12465, partial [Pristionchus entomophagus]
HSQMTNRREWSLLEQGDFLFKTVEKEESFDTACKDENRMPSRNDPRLPKFTNVLDELYGNDELLISKSVKAREIFPKVSQMKLSSYNGSFQLKESRVSKGSDTEMECPECKLRTKCVNSMMVHLTLK